MNNIWFISDTHFNHTNVLKFTDVPGGNKIRSEFSSLEEMNEVMIKNWNNNVSVNDKVYHLGDVIFGSSQDYNKILSRLNGKKRLVIGNHDNIQNKELAKHFQKIMLWRVFKEHNFVASHIPIHNSEIISVRYNVHGHIHQKPNPSPIHLNISVEKINYTPIHIDEIRTKLNS